MKGTTPVQQQQPERRPLLDYAQTYVANTRSFLAGSAVYKSFIPCLVSSIVYLVLSEVINLHDVDKVLLLHPYPLGALISALTFLLAFRANFSYNRYWESMTAVSSARLRCRWRCVVVATIA
jgi:predicted membrane chloride channel (bestrophin family)